MCIVFQEIQLLVTNKRCDKSFKNVFKNNYLNIISQNKLLHTLVLIISYVKILQIEIDAFTMTTAFAT